MGEAAVRSPFARPSSCQQRRVLRALAAGKSPGPRVHRSWRTLASSSEILWEYRKGISIEPTGTSEEGGRCHATPFSSP